MTLREKIHERIDRIDEALLPKLLKQLEHFERHGRFSDDFWEALRSSHERNEDLSGEEASRIATRAVREDRQSRKP